MVIPTTTGEDDNPMASEVMVDERHVSDPKVLINHRSSSQLSSENEYYSQLMGT